MYTPDTIILIHGSSQCKARDWRKKIFPGEAVFGIDNNSQYIKKWPAEEEASAYKELSSKKCEYYRTGDTIWLDEWALMWCECDEDGEFISGADYELAEELDHHTSGFDDEED